MNKILKRVSNIAQQLAAKVSIQDQILLLGPPYKVPKDSTLRSEEVLASLRLGDEEDKSFCSLDTTERSGARRLFLFSKKHLSGSGPNLPPCVLHPTTISLPTEPDTGPLVFQRDFSTPTSPLHQALEVYERQFMLNLCQGRALADGADLRIASCRSCIAEQSVIAQALRAAVSNLSFFRNNAIRIRTELTTDFQSKTSKHFNLLDQFDRKMATLAEERLHPALVNVAKTSGRMIETLLDTVPVEKEKVWAAQCRTAHERLLGLFSEIDTSFGNLRNDAEREEEARKDRATEEMVISLSHEIEQKAMQIRDKQAERLDQLTKDHTKVVSVVMDAISGDNDQAQVAHASFSTLETMSKMSADILPCMKADDEKLMELMTRIGNTKTEAMTRMKDRLHKISFAQSSIGHVLKRVDFLQKCLAQQNEDMVHLEHVIELKSSYRDFLSEIRRRRAYGNAVASSASAVMESLAAMRVDEVRARERFLRGSGRHLMPAFFEIFTPTLATPPPFFNPQFPSMVEMDTLPDVGINDETARSGYMSSNADNRDESISVESNQQSDKTSSTMNQNENLATPNTEVNIVGKPNQISQSSVVSVNESSNEIMVSCPEDRASADAEHETLKYENAALRQIIERSGIKAPRSYVEEARTKDKKKPVGAGNDDMEALKAKIEALESSLEVKTKEVNNLKEKGDTKDLPDKLCDKISHSSFAVSI